MLFLQLPQLKALCTQYFSLRTNQSYKSPDINQADSKSTFCDMAKNWYRATRFLWDNPTYLRNLRKMKGCHLGHERICMHLCMISNWEGAHQSARRYIIKESCSSCIVELLCLPSSLQRVTLGEIFASIRLVPIRDEGICQGDKTWMNNQLT
jgi:hypothetical protein